MTKAYYVQVAEQIFPIYGVSTLDEAQDYVAPCDHTKIVETEDDVYMDVATGRVDFSSNWDDLDEVTPVVYSADLETWVEVFSFDNLRRSGVVMCRKRYKMPSSKSAKTYAVIDGVDYNDVVAEYDSSEPEKDVNWPGDFEVTSVTVCGVEMIGYMSQDEIDSIAERLEYDLSYDGEEDPRY